MVIGKWDTPYLVVVRALMIVEVQLSEKNATLQFRSTASLKLGKVADDLRR